MTCTSLMPHAWDISADSWTTAVRYVHILEHPSDGLRPKYSFLLNSFHWLYFLVPGGCRQIAVLRLSPTMARKRLSSMRSLRFPRATKLRTTTSSTKTARAVLLAIVVRQNVENFLMHSSVWWNACRPQYRTVGAVHAYASSLPLTNLWHQQYIEKTPAEEFHAVEASEILCDMWTAKCAVGVDLHSRPCMCC